MITAAATTSTRFTSIVGGAIGGTAGVLLAHRMGGGAARYLGFGAALGVAGAWLGAQISSGAGGATNGREVGTAYGRRTIDKPDGTSEWAQVTAPLLLGRRVGAAEGYATLAAAVSAARPNTGNGEMAFIRNGAAVDAYQLVSPDLKAVEAYRATGPDVIAFTSRESGDIFAGPAATDTERSKMHLVSSPPAPFDN